VLTSISAVFSRHEGEISPLVQSGFAQKNVCLLKPEGDQACCDIPIALGDEKKIK